MESVMLRKVGQVYRTSVPCAPQQLRRSPFAHPKLNVAIAQIPGLQLFPPQHGVADAARPGRLVSPLGNVGAQFVEVWIKQRGDEVMSLEHELYLGDLLRSLRFPKLDVFVFLERGEEVVPEGMVEVPYGKRPSPLQVLPPDASWVAAGRVKNAVMNDHLVDYLELNRVYAPTDAPDRRKRKRRLSLDGFTRFVMDRGNQFEARIAEELRARYPGDFVEVGSSIDARSCDAFLRTLREMKRGTAFIYQPVLWNHRNRTLGCADLIVRSDRLAELFGEAAAQLLHDTDLSAGCVFSATHHYRVIDVKSSLLDLTRDTVTLCNQGWFRYYKTQVLVYHLALADMQGHTPAHAYIWGRDPHARDARRFAVVDYEGADASYHQVLEDALRWLRDVSNNAHWTHSPPSDPRLLPNMGCSINGAFQPVKVHLAQTNAEITQLWQVGVQHRNRAVSQGVWRLDDPRLSSALLGITHPKNARIVDRMIEGVRNPDAPVVAFAPGTKVDLPKHGVRRVYLDIETVNGTLYGCGVSSNLVFMVGIGWEGEDGAWQHRCLVADALSSEEEARLLGEMLEVVGSANDQVEVCHWGLFERVTLLPKLQALGLRHGHLRFHDLCQWMVDHEVVVRGALDFGLKTVGRAMRANGLTDLSWPPATVDGLEAMHHAWEHYTNNALRDNALRDIAAYNETDCRMMLEVHRVLEKYITL
jgi:hypothetical protein